VARLRALLATLLVSLASAASAHASLTFETSWYTATPGDEYQSAPWGIASTPSGDLVIADSGAHAVKAYSAAGALRGSWRRDSFVYPHGLADGPGGRIFAASSDRIWRLSPELVPSRAWSGTGAGNLSHPWGLALDRKGDVYVADREHDRVAVFTPDGDFVRAFTGSGEARIAHPFDVAVAPDGRVFVLNDTNPPPPHAIVGFSRTGEFLGAIDLSALLISDAAPFPYPKGIAIGPDGRIYVADQYQSRVFVLSPTGAREAIVGAPGRAPGQFRSPADVDVDCHGNLAVTDVYLGRVTLFSAGVARGDECPPPPEPPAAPPPLLPPPASGPVAPMPDLRAPDLRLAVRRVQRLGRAATISLVARCDERCVVSAGGALGCSRPRWRQALPTAGGELRRAGRVGLRITLPSRLARRVRAALRRRSRVTAALAVAARDAAGNRVLRRVRVRLR
jgi:hypothetical protein